MPANDSYLAQLVNLIDGGDFTVLFGAGASREGWRDGKPLPLYPELQRDYMRRFRPGFDVSNDDTLKQEFIDIIKEHTDDNTLIPLIGPYFSGTPGFAHAQFAAIAKLLSRRKFFLRILTTNFDDMVESAARAVFEGVHPFSVPTLQKDEREQQCHYNNVDRHIENGQPVIMHLFGDNSFSTPIFFPNSNLDGHFHRVSLNQVRQYLAKPLIVIGYSFVDQALANLVADSQAGRNPVYIVDPSDIGVKRLSTSRPIRHIKATFGEFTELLADKCREREEFRGGALEKMLANFPGEYLLPTVNALRARTATASETAQQRARSRIGGSGGSSGLAMTAIIDRPDSGPRYRDFLTSPDKVQLIIGRSGAGKTTMLWRIYQDLRENNICLYYDSASLDTSLSLHERLGQDLYFSKEGRARFFGHIERILSQDTKLVIFLDGINETKRHSLDTLVAEIHDCAAEWPGQIKAFVTCRDVYWDSEVSEPVKAQREYLFLNRADRLEQFSARETELAYLAYAEQFGLRTPFASLPESVVEKMRYPLMLRMLAEAYRDQAIPSYVPAVKVFRHYRDSLRKRFAGGNTFDFLIHMVEWKVGQVLAGGSAPCADDRLDPMDFGAATSAEAKQNFIKLADEGILQEIEDRTYAAGHYYRFIYDRFFEFLFGEAWGRFMRRQDGDRGVLLIGQVQIFSGQSLTFQRALIAELVNQNMTEGAARDFDFEDRGLVQGLLRSGNPLVADLARQVLRELIHDAEADFIGAVWGDELSAEVCEQILEIAGDAPKTLPVHLQALSTDIAGEELDRLRDKAIRLAEPWCRDEAGRTAFDSALSDWVQAQPQLTAQIVRGLVFYSTLLLKTTPADRLGAVGQLWRSLLANRRDDPGVLRALIGVVLIDLAKSRGPRFFPSSTPRPPFGDYSAYPLSARAKARQLMAMLTHADQPLRPDDVDVIAFFGSEIRDWEDLHSGTSNVPAMYYPFEYRIAQWVLLLQSRRDFDQAAAYMDTIANLGLVATLDYALCTMKFALQQVYRDDPRRVMEGALRMRSWVNLAKDRFAGDFFAPLSSPDPLTRTDNMLSQTARIEAQMAPGCPIAFLAEFMRSSDIRECRLAVLSARHLWPSHAAEILLTFESLDVGRDADVKAWYLVTLGEMYGRFPKQVEDYLDKVQLSTVDRLAVRAGARESIADRSYFGDEVYREIFFDDGRRLFLAKAYADLIEAADFEIWARELTLTLIDRILGR